MKYGVLCELNKIADNGPTYSYRCRRCGRNVSAAKLHKQENIRLRCLNQPLFALGEFVAWLIHTVTLGLVEPCLACDKRRRFLNRWFYVPNLFRRT